ARSGLAPMCSRHVLVGGPGLVSRRGPIGALPRGVRRIAWLCFRARVLGPRFIRIIWSKVRMTLVYGETMTEVEQVLALATRGRRSDLEDQQLVSSFVNLGEEACREAARRN